MTVIEMAIEAELIYNEEGWCGWVEDTDLRPFIERFAALVRADEREACAKLCDDISSDKHPEMLASDLFAELIRARGETK